MINGNLDKGQFAEADIRAKGIGPSGATLSTPPHATRYAWVVLALLWPVALLNYMDRQMMAAMKFSIMADIPTVGSEANWGLLPAVFLWVYAILSPFGGYVADRFGKKWVIVTSLFVWSLVTLATGYAHTFNQMILSRAMMGISEACYIPAALALIADYHDGPTRSRAVGIHQMAIYVGVIIGGFSGYVADHPGLGWRWAFGAAGIAGALYAIPLVFFLKNPPAIRPREGDKAPSGNTLKELVTNKYFLILIAYFTLPALAGWVVKDWMPAILKSEFGIGQGRAGVSATLFVNIAALVGVLGGGLLADRFTRFTIRGRIYVSAAGTSLLIPALFGVGNANGLIMAVAFLVLFGLGWGFFDCNNMPILCQVVRPESRATGYGLMNMVSISCGGFADWGFGTMRDHHVPLNVIFGAFSMACLLAAALVLLIRPKTESELARS